MAFDNGIVLSAESNVSLAAATTAVNTLIASEIAAASPQPVQVFNVSNGIAVGPIYVVSVLIKYQG